jgi:hypothetical protein
VSSNISGRTDTYSSSRSRTDAVAVGLIEVTELDETLATVTRRTRRQRDARDGNVIAQPAQRAPSSTHLAFRSKLVRLARIKLCRVSINSIPMASRKHGRGEASKSNSCKAQRKNQCCVSMQWAGPPLSKEHTAHELNCGVAMKFRGFQPLKILTCFEAVSPVSNLAKYYDHIEEIMVTTPPFLGIAMTSERKAVHCFTKFPQCDSNSAQGCLWHNACDTDGKVDLLLADQAVCKGSRLDEFEQYLKVGKPSRVLIFMFEGAPSKHAIIKKCLEESGYPEPQVSSYNTCSFGLPRVQDLYVISARFGVRSDTFGKHMQQVVDAMGRKAVAIESLCASVGDELARGWALKRKASGKDVDEHESQMEHFRQSKLLPEGADIPDTVVVSGALSGRGLVQANLLTYYMRKIAAPVGFTSFGSKDCGVMCHIDGSMTNVSAGKTAVLAVARGEAYQVRVLDLPHLLALQGYDPALYNLAVSPTSAVSDAVSRATPFQVVLAAFAAALRVDDA